MTEVTENLYRHFEVLEKGFVSFLKSSFMARAFLNNKMHKIFVLLND